MSFKVEHNYRFDAAGKLDADDWVFVPRSALRADFTLDSAFADELAQCYFETVRTMSLLPLKLVSDTRGVRYLVPAGKTAIVFAEPERSVDALRVETSWLIAGGFMLAHRVNYGGRFYIGAEWAGDDGLKLYSAIRRYPPRLVNWFGVSRGVAVYNRTQGILHKQTTDRFLNEMAARVTRSTP
jgi:hypothetical protein